MEAEAINRVVSGEASAAALEGLLRSVVWSVLTETTAAAGRALVQLLLALGSLSSEIGVLTEKEDIEERFNIPVARRNKNQATAETKDDGETDDDDDDEDEEDDDVDDQDDDAGDEDFSGEDVKEGEEDVDPEANGDEGSEEDDDEDEEEDDDGDEDDEEDEDDDEDEEEEQPPSKKRK